MPVHSRECADDVQLRRTRDVKRVNLVVNGLAVVCPESVSDPREPDGTRRAVVLFTGRELQSGNTTTSGLQCPRTTGRTDRVAGSGQAGNSTDRGSILARNSASKTASASPSAVSVPLARCTYRAGEQCAVWKGGVVLSHRINESRTAPCGPVSTPDESPSTAAQATQVGCSEKAVSGADSTVSVTLTVSASDRRGRDGRMHTRGIAAGEGISVAVVFTGFVSLIVCVWRPVYSGDTRIRHGHADR